MKKSIKYILQLSDIDYIKTALSEALSKTKTSLEFYEAKNLLAFFEEKEEDYFPRNENDSHLPVFIDEEFSKKEFEILLNALTDYVRLLDGDSDDYKEIMTIHTCINESYEELLEEIEKND